MSYRTPSGSSAFSPPIRSPDSYNPLSPTASSSSRPLPFPYRGSRAPSMMSTFSSATDTTALYGHIQANGRAAKPYTPSSNLRNISSSSIGASGSSTPDYKRRARRMVEKGLIAEEEKDKDWANIEPDEVFRRLPVNEVKRVEGKMRKEALDKQSELRAMVGTRYRDLLTSATQISTLLSASLQLSASLRSIAETCSNPDDIAITAETSTQVSDTDDVLTILPVAAHMKLLLDAPEALYACLGEGEVLRAGWLWLVARVVKESLAGMGEAGEAYQPLLVKQWEVLLPFRAQIVQKATEMLLQELDQKILAETLLTIILLDNLPVPDALTLFLQQRNQALRHTLAHTHSTSPVVDESGHEGTDQAREGPSTSSVLANGIRWLLETSQAVQEVFGQRNRSGGPGDESLLEEMIRLVQRGEINPPMMKPTPVRRTSSSSHTRRASRLVSISLPFTDPALSASSEPSPPISTIRIIQSLPSSQILLRHLPAAITGFTPFITPPQRPDLPAVLSAWQEEGIQVLRERTPAWLEDLRTAQAVWAVRGAVADRLGDGEFEGRIGGVLDDEWGARIRGVWAVALEGMVQATEKEVEIALDELGKKGGYGDINPDKHVFSSMTFPSIPSATLSTPNPISFPAFMSSLKKRGSYRTPLLDRVLLVLEQSARELKADVQELPSDLSQAYQGLVEDGLSKMVDSLQNLLRKVIEREEDDQRVWEELFIGRVALFLARQSTFLEDISASSGLSTTETTTSLLSLHVSSTSTWQTQSISTALTQFSTLFDPLRGPQEVKATWQGPHPISPSAAIIVALNSLVGAIRHLGIPPEVKDVGVVKGLVHDFVDQARELGGWGGLKEEACVQAVVDLGFLGMVRGDKDDEDPAVQDMIQRIPESYQSLFLPLLPAILAESLRRVQLILHPLLTHLDPGLPQIGVAGQIQQSKSSTLGRSSTGDTRSQLLRFGPPLGKIAAINSIDRGVEEGVKSGVTTSVSMTEFRSPIAVTKPGKRFGLVSIVS